MKNLSVSWYRNASEKDQDKAVGTGQLHSLAVLPSESIAVIIDSNGEFHEKPLSLIRVTDKDTSEIDAANQTIRELSKELSEAGELINKLKKQQTTVSKKPVSKSN
jgi:TolA-binding protein